MYTGYKIVNMINKINRILKDVQYKMKELENEYSKRLNYYKGFRENKRFIDPKYDRVFGSIPQDITDNEYQGIYSGTESEESLKPRDLSFTPYSHPSSHEDQSISPLRRKYTGLEHNLCEYHQEQLEQPYGCKKVRFDDQPKCNRSHSYNKRSHAFDMYKTKNKKR